MSKRAGLIPDIKKWTVKHGFSMPTRPKKQPMFPDADFRNEDGEFEWCGVPLVEDDLEGAICKLKAERDGEMEVADPDLAQSLTELGLIDEYQIYLDPVVLGHGNPYFAGLRPPLRLMTHDRIGEYVIRLSYVPAWSRDSPPGWFGAGNN